MFLVAKNDMTTWPTVTNTDQDGGVESHLVVNEVAQSWRIIESAKSCPGSELVNPDITDIPWDPYTSLGYGISRGLFHCSWRRSPRGDSTIICNPPIFGSMEAIWSIQNLKRFRIIQCLLIKPANVLLIDPPTSGFNPLNILPSLPLGCHRIGSCCTPAVAEATSGPKSCGIVELIRWHIKTDDETPIGRWPLNISGLRYR